MDYTRRNPLHKEALRFLTLPGEQLILAQKQHWIVLVKPLLGAFTMFILFVGFSSFFYAIGYVPLTLFITLTLLVFSIILSFVTVALMEWYFHLFIVTSRKILEVSYSPFTQKIDDVFLDQVRIIEIDVQKNNVLYQLVDIGNIVIYFDRPSHEECFTLSNIKHPKSTGIFLADALETIMHRAPIWFQSREGAERNSGYNFVDDDSRYYKKHSPLRS
jgi:hypothetical protein